MLLPSLLTRTAPIPSAPKGIPLAPGWLPLVGHVPQVVHDAPSLVAACAQAGPFSWLDMGRGPCQLFSTREEAFAIFRNRDTSSRNFSDISESLLGRSLLVLDGLPHRRARGALASPFTPRGLNASSAGKLVREVIEPRVARWAHLPEVPLTEETREFAVDIIFRMMGIPSSELPAWRHRFEELILLVFPWDIDLPRFPRRRGLDAKAWIDRRLSKFIEQARTRAPDADLVAAMVHGRDEQGEGLDAVELLDNLRILVFAGHETTASVMSWMALELAKHPAYWQRAVDEALAGDGPPTTAEELTRFPFMESVFRESLRLHPPATFDSRHVETEMDLLGVKIPQGVVIGCSLYALSRNPERYPDPDRFHPDRWASLPRKAGALETAQFGGGPHFCLGYHMAWLEAVQFGVTLARELGKRNLRPILVDGVMPKPVWFPASRPPAGTRIRLARMDRTSGPS